MWLVIAGGLLKRQKSRGGAGIRFRPGEHLTIQYLWALSSQRVGVQQGVYSYEAQPVHIK